MLHLLSAMLAEIFGDMTADLDESVIIQLVQGAKSSITEYMHQMCVLAEALKTQVKCPTKNPLFRGRLWTFYFFAYRASCHGGV